MTIMTIMPVMPVMPVMPFPKVFMYSGQAQYLRYSGGGAHTPRVFVHSGQAQYLYYSGGNPHAQSILIFRPSPIFVLFRGEPTRPGYSYIQAMPNMCIIPGGEPLWECHRHPVVSSWETRKNPIESLWDHHRDPYRDPIGFPIHQGVLVY